MKVLFLTHSFPRTDGDAAGSFVLELAAALRGEDVQVEVVAPAAPGLASSETFDGVTVDRFRYAPRRYESLAYTGTMAEQVRASWSARFSLVGFLGAEFTNAVRVRRRFEPDLVHAHWWFPSGLVGTWVSRLASIPLVTTLHGTDVRLARGVGFARPLFRQVVKHSTAITTVSHWLAREVAAVAPDAQPHVAPMPVATDLFQPGGERSADRLLFVGRLNEQKGIEHLLRALALMRVPASLDVVGGGDGRPALDGLAAELGVGDRVRFHGPVSHAVLPAFYRAAAALVVPSVDEGLGLVAVEAQLCNTPVVASESGGLPDVVRHDQTGVLVPPRDPSALAGALDSMLLRPDRGASLGAAGRMHALAMFAPESVARRYARIYQEALGGTA